MMPASGLKCQPVRGQFVRATLLVARQTGRHKAGPYDQPQTETSVGATLLVARRAGRHKAGSYEPLADSRSTATTYRSRNSIGPRVKIGK